MTITTLGNSLIVVSCVLSTNYGNIVGDALPNAVRRPARAIAGSSVPCNAVRETLVEVPCLRDDLGSVCGSPVTIKRDLGKMGHYWVRDGLIKSITSAR